MVPIAKGDCRLKKTFGDHESSFEAEARETRSHSKNADIDATFQALLQRSYEGAMPEVRTIPANIEPEKRVLH